MDGLNTVDIPTISGLKHLTLDQIDTSILNAETIFLDNIETTNIIIDNQIVLLSGANILTNSLNISDVEISYLDGVRSNIQQQIDSFGDINSIVYENQSNITVLQGKTQNFNASVGLTTSLGNISFNPGLGLIVNSKFISDVELSYLDGATSNIQTQLVALQNKTQNLVASAGYTTSLGNISFNPGLGLLVNSKFISDVEISYLDGLTSNIQQQIDSFGQNNYAIQINAEKLQNQNASAFQTSFEGNITTDSLIIRAGGQLLFGSSYQVDAFTTAEKTKLSWLNITGTELLINQIKYLDNSIQTTAFTSGYITYISDLQNKTTNLTRSGTISNFSGSVYTPILSLGTQINFPDSTVQTTAYIPPSPRVKTRIYSSSLWGTTWAFNTAYDSSYTYEISGGSDDVFSSGKVIKPGRYMITFNAHCTNLKWFNKLISRIIIKNQPSGSQRAASMFVGRNLGGSVELTNEDDIYYEVSLMFDCTTTLDTSFAIYHEYKFASTNVSGQTTLFWGEINVYEI
jgi:hypothetical protein